MRVTRGHDIIRETLGQAAGRRQRSVAALLVAVAAWASAGGALGGEKPAAPPLRPVEVKVEPSPAYPRVDVHYRGFRISADHRRAEGMEWTIPHALFPNPGQPLELQVSVTAYGGDRKVRVTGTVRDYLEKELAKVDLEIAAAKDQTASRYVSFTPREEDTGPFFFIGQWAETAGDGKGAIPAGGPENSLPSATAMPNARFVIESFECVRYPEAGATVENSPAAMHNGQMGLILRPKVPANAKPGPKGEPAQAQHLLPLDRTLPGRPVRMGVWAKASAPARLTLRVRDPGIEVGQSAHYDRWAIGPVDVAPGDWRYVAFPAPGYGLPKWQRETPGLLASGFVDYPLTLEALEVECPAAATVMVDEVDVYTQMERENVVRLSPVVDKPAGLLYRNDAIRLELANGWLWGQPTRFQYAASLNDIAGKDWPLANATVDLAPGAEAFVQCKIDNLPCGSYRLKATINAGNVCVAKIEQERGLLVYEPTGKPLPIPDLMKFLAGRNGLLADLGFRRDQVPVPWHSSDGSISVEPVQGLFDFDWLNAEFNSRRQAGFELIGRLAFTPVWADPGVSYQTASNSWAGNTTVMPSQRIYWEEYVYRTVANFAGQIDNWIVWDRPDTQGFASGPDEYVERMVAVAHRAASEANPNARLISGGVSRESLEDFLTGLIESGAGQYLSAVGVFPATPPLSPEDSYMDVILSRAQRLRAQEGFKPELWVLDLGWPTGSLEGSVTEDDQARYVARAWAICRATGAARVLVEPHRTFVDSAIRTYASRDTSDLLFQEMGIFGIKPAALAAKAARAMLDDAAFIREVFLVDRWDGLTRAYLFALKDGRMVMSAWRRHGTSRLRLPATAEKVLDVFGNAVTVGADGLALHAAPHYVIFSAQDANALARQLERAPLEYEDAPESAWKRAWSFYLDVGDEADEKAAQYAATDARLAGPLDSNYYNDYGRHVVDSGRHFRGEEKFVVDVSAYGKADMIIRKRIDYLLPNQRVKVFCNDKEVGQWFAYKRDRRFRWRNIDFIVPNGFFAGQKTAALRFAAQDGLEATSYAYWLAPLPGKTLYASDISLLVSNSGYGPGVNLDKNILGGPIKFHKGDGKEHAKGIGTNSASTFEGSLVVIPLNKQFKRFRATVGIDVATGGKGTVRFRVGDGKKMLYDSDDMNYFNDPKEIDIDVSDSILLMLSVGDCGDGNKNDLADWADARLELK